MITTKQMAELEREAEEIGISKLELMENAGKNSAEYLVENFDLSTMKIIIVCYHGNNGGDGFAVARYLNSYAIVKVLFIGDIDKLSFEARSNYDALKDLEKEENEIFIENIGDIFGTDLKEYDLIIDAMLGTGGAGKLKEPISSMVDAINRSKRKVVSLDIPTGMDPNSGVVSDKVVNASLVLCFHDIKSGLKEISGIVKIIDIGMP